LIAPLNLGMKKTGPKSKHQFSVRSGLLVLPRFH
jgi:hypothetical protein